MVSDAQKSAIKSSWAGVNLQAAGTAFYTQLANKEPEVYAIFKLGADPKSAKAQAQGLKVMEFVDVCVTNLGNMDTVNAKLDELAKRHINYGVMKKHFAPAGPCFLNALAEVQGGKFTADARSAWTALYEIIATALSAYLS